MNHYWKGNIRELQNVVEYATNLCESKQIELQDLPPKLVAQFSEEEPIKKRKTDSQMEKEQLLPLLEKYGHTLEGKKRIAKELNVSLRTLYRRLELYGLK